MDSPKSLEELDKIIESQKQHREIEYERRKWLFAISGFSHLSFGINTFPDLIEKDKDFWKILPVVWLIFVVLIGSVFLLIRETNTPDYIPLAFIPVIFLVLRLFLGIYAYQRIKIAFPDYEMGSIKFILRFLIPYDLINFRIISLLVIAFGLLILYLLSKV
ncbi:hypothetical protein A2W45_01630 [Candidatus Curtissbacteria bacterium RIFCSPHIGHO2_12_41_11]|uniref:Uncharacterized protein n=2 Tax=Candidatus Curtissiibacteriota TaxID=1752717 RepID=A0A0G0Y6G1_9BACT|nr:MAG: hypothetical protein UU56_C0001G0013 [Candidatus Curtissbacteria bacterium GW2011_GWA2_41_24]OGD90265.1 MAG: hypothetical protein A2Z54_01430 [Candidatus Curtissbacteria bacterium RIFCSPHIGHO2_02_39_8]OGD98069.1 MAG: hypothetical protein A2W45_01630 [Candidatus Curtissbacteria bacterium RIFCSPHIGHO2_12_41_11]